MSHRDRPSHPVIPANSHFVPAQWNPVIPANSHFVIPANAGIHSLHATLDPGVRRDDCSTGGAA